MIDTFIMSLFLHMNSPDQEGTQNERWALYTDLINVELGHCSNDDVSIDMENVFYIEGSNIRYRFDNEIIDYSINPAFLYVNYIEESIRHSLSESSGIDQGMDIIARFAIYEGDLYVYWRESFVNRLYQQGLILVQPNGISEFCTGVGGVQAFYH